jgi:hypothetical protein
MQGRRTENIRATQEAVPLLIGDSPVGDDARGLIAHSELLRDLFRLNADKV